MQHAVAGAHMFDEPTGSQSVPPNVLSVAMSPIIDLVLFVSEGRALIVDEKLTQHGRDGIFPSVRILSGPPVADAVIAATIFHPHFPSMRAM